MPEQEHSLNKERDDRDGNSPSPFANLKQDSSTDGKPIWRTGSLDEGWRKMPAEEQVDENHDKDTSVVTALHSSFDASLFEDERHDSSIFRPTSAGKHARNAEEQDFIAPGTVRKLRRRSDLPPGSKNTPGRHSHNLRTQGSATGTPTSAARRRRVTLQRRSPRHKASAKVPAAATPVIFKFQEIASPAVPRTSLFGGTTTQLKHPVLTPTRAGTPGLPYATTAKKTQTCHTATTVNSSFDGMNESHETSSPTPFRFTTFPASLPRVNNPRSTYRNYMFPPSTRKQMAFSAFAVCEEGEAEKAPNANSSQEEDVTQNSSLSSLSADGQREVAASSVQPKTLQWKSPEDEEMDYRRNSIDSEVAEHRLGAASPVHARLFADDEELAASPGQNSKQKLDFHPTASPFKPHGDRREIKYTFGNEKDSDIDLSRPYEQRKTNSFPSTASSTTPLRNISTFEDATIDSGMTPSGGAGGMHMADNNFSPEQQVKFHFHVDATQCSPIPGIPEEEGEDVVTRNVPLMAMIDTDGPTSSMEPNISSRQVKERPPRSMPRKRSQRHSGGSHSSWKGSTPSKQDSSKLSLSNESGDGGSSSASSNQRRLRPMPDMNAFDAGISRSASSSRNDTDESSGNIMTSRAAPPSPQLVCPPTPQRTPAWASYTEQGPQPKYSRQNSLIATKVLATCPTQVLDGHSSLESSLMEDDEEEIVEPSGPLFGRTPSKPFSSVAEDVEEKGDDDEESPIRELPGLHEMLAAQPSNALMPRLKRHTSAPVGDTVMPAPLVASTSCSGRVGGESDSSRPKRSISKTPASPRLSSGSFGGGVGAVISFSSDFDNLGKLGSGAFADVYKVRSKTDQQLYAVKRNRRHFRGKRDRDMAMAEVRIMQRLQSVCAQSGSSSDKKEKTKNSYSLYLLFFLRAWQEEGHFFCQTELCCRDTCRELKITIGPQWLTSQRKYPTLSRHFLSSSSHGEGHLIPERTIWKICHDVAAGLSHIHSHGVVHNDIKPSNIFLVAHSRLGALLKIGDFGMAGDIGTAEDGQEGDTSYMAPELLSSSGTRQPSADIFSLGLTLYELASNLSWQLPSEGSRWQELRHGSHTPDLPCSRNPALGHLIQKMIRPDPTLRPSADAILEQVSHVKQAGGGCDEFLRDYIRDIEAYDRIEDERAALEKLEADERGQTPRNAHGRGLVAARDIFAGSPPPTTSFAPALFTPEPAAT